MSERTKTFLLAMCGSLFLGQQLGLRVQELVPGPWSIPVAVVLGGGVGVVLGLVLIEVVHLRLTGTPMTREDYRQVAQFVWDVVRPSWWRRSR